jgi:hypothetical protein
MLECLRVVYLALISTRLEKNPTHQNQKVPQSLVSFAAPPATDVSVPTAHPNRFPLWVREGTDSTYFPVLTPVAGPVMSPPALLFPASLPQLIRNTPSSTNQQISQLALDSPWTATTR